MNKERITYEIVEDGYMLYLDGKAWIKQHTEHFFCPELSAEENAQLHIEELCKPIEKPTVQKQIAELEAKLAELKEQVNE